MRTGSQATVTEGHGDLRSHVYWGLEGGLSAKDIGCLITFPGDHVRILFVSLPFVVEQCNVLLIIK